MNVEFPDRLSAVCFHNMVRDAKHREQFMDWLTTFMWGSWMQDSGPWELNSLGRPDWAKQSGRMAKLVIGVYNSSIYMTEDGPMADEFDWCVWMPRSTSTASCRTSPSGGASSTGAGSTTGTTRSPTGAATRRRPFK